MNNFLIKVLLYTIKLTSSNKQVNKMTNKTPKQLERELSLGEKLRQKYKVQNSDKLALRIARRMGLTYFNPYKGKEYISPSNCDDGGQWKGFPNEKANENFWTANRILWTKGLTVGGDNWREGKISDLGNRLRILDNFAWRGEQWLSGWKKEDYFIGLKTLEIIRNFRENDPRGMDGLSQWYRSYAYKILQIAYKYNSETTFREGFSYTSEHFEQIKEYYKNHPSEVKEDFKKKMNHAITNRIYRAKTKNFRKISSAEKRKLREIYEEVNEVKNLQTEKKDYQPKSFTPAQWESYKRINLNPNPSIADKIYSGLNKVLALLN